jgi:hypothetical protein
MATDKIRVHVYEEDYDQQFYVELHDLKEHPGQNLEDSVEVDRWMYEEYDKLTARLGELETYFLAFRSDNQIAWENKWTRERDAERIRRAEVLEFIMKDPAYINAQERLNAKRKG